MDSKRVHAATELDHLCSERRRFGKREVFYIRKSYKRVRTFNAYSRCEVEMKEADFLDSVIIKRGGGIGRERKGRRASGQVSWDKNCQVPHCLNMKEAKAVVEIMANKRMHAPFEEEILFKSARILPYGNIYLPNVASSPDFQEKVK